jgi:hypothetical protein
MSESEESVVNNTIPKRVFIIPYRNRIQHKFFFSKYMSFILEDDDDYEIYFSHQCDSRSFNRGATRNIGFLAVKEKYPNDYKNITFIFNDIDTIPFTKIFDYKTSPGVVKHYYGYTHALGGIVVIKGADFERINGYPCYWGWGMEDNALQKRCNWANFIIDRSQFYKIGSPQILQLFDGITRIINKKDPLRMQQDNGFDGVKTITQLKYNISDKSDNNNDNIFAVHNSHIFYINIQTFQTYINFENEAYYNYDLREPTRKIIDPDNNMRTMRTIVNNNEWTNIPSYPTIMEKLEKQMHQLKSQGKAIPQKLIQELEKEKNKDSNKDVFNININNSISTNHNKKKNNPFAQDYAKSIGHQSRAKTSARIGLGGVF